MSTSITRTPKGHLVFSYFDNIRLLQIWNLGQRIKEFSNFLNLDDQSWNYFAQTKFFLTSFHSDIILLSIPYTTTFLKHSTRGQHVPKQQVSELNILSSTTKKIACIYSEYPIKCTKKYTKMCQWGAKMYTKMCKRVELKCKK